MTRKRTSPIWNTSKEELQELLDNSDSVSDVLRSFGLNPASGNHRTLRERVKLDDLSLEELNQNLKVAQRKRGKLKKVSSSTLLVKNSKVGSSKLKKRILDEGLLENKCSMCGIGPEWNGKALVLQLDHINGDSTDNRIENLRIVCPNCHTQTETFSGKHKAAPPNVCKSCQKVITREAEVCMRCAGFKTARHKIDWPTLEIVQGMVAEKGYRGTGKILGVTDNSVRRYIERRVKSV